MPKQHQESRLKPITIQLIRLRWMGYDDTEIAQRSGYPVEQIRRTLNSSEAKEIFVELHSLTLDTMAEVAQELQLAAPLAAKRMAEHIFSGDDRVSLMASKDVLDRTGHVPVKRVSISGPTRVEKDYEGLNDQQIKQRLLEELTNDETVPSGAVIN
jgi:hypothetical protein